MIAQWLLILLYRHRATVLFRILLRISMLCFLARGDHLPAFLGRDRHRLLAEDVDPGLCRADRVLGVHRVRQRDVDRVDYAQAVVELVVVEGVLDAIPPRELTALRTVAADDADLAGQGASEQQSGNTEPDRRQAGQSRQCR